MVTYEALHQQNHQITELSNVLAHLLTDRSMCDTGTCCELFYRYMDVVHEHMDVVDTHLYPRLIKHSDTQVNNLAKGFMNGSVELKRIMNQYSRKWCDPRHHSLAIGDRYESFITETREMFDLILDRIQRETEHLYPVVRKISGDHQRAA
jgi:hemerythrin-like domain-containing protein